MSKKLTPWFPGNVKPVRSGYYERDWTGDGNTAGFDPDYWDGDIWRLSKFGIAWRQRAKALPWRGLAKAPE
jgi:hypothetical protein